MSIRNYPGATLGGKMEKTIIREAGINTPLKTIDMEDAILENWFNFITVKTFQLFNKYGVK